MSAQIKRGFASDNNSGVHPNMLKAMSSVNMGHEIAYHYESLSDANGNMERAIKEQDPASCLSVFGCETERTPD